MTVVSALMILFYNLILAVFFIPIFILFLLRYRTRLATEFFYRWRERFGILQINQPDDTRPALWVHCASIGEVRAVEPLLAHLKDYRIFMSVHTLAGRQYAENMRLAHEVFFAPLDFGFIVARAMKKINPCGLILVETEFWPGLLWAAKKMNVTVVVVNGRLSARSFPFYSATGFFWKYWLSSIGRIAARSAEDAARFISLGVPEERIFVTGNLKYDRPAENAAAGKTTIGFNDGDFVIVAGSTRSGEEALIFEAFNEIRARLPGARLIIAPRHINRVGKVCALAGKYGIPFALYSRRDGVSGSCIIVDIFGELTKIYSACDAAFVGGSLVKKGGQNPIEPASFGKPVLFGPHMFNFNPEKSLLMQAGGGIEVSNKEQLIEAVLSLAHNGEMRRAAGKKAIEAVESQKGSVERTVKIIKEALTL